MFRRQTDEVFSTLQQVQRRLSQHTEPGADSVTQDSSSRQATGGGTATPSASPSRQPAPSRAARVERPAAAPSRYPRDNFRVQTEEQDQPAHVVPVPVVDRSAIGGTGPTPPSDSATNLGDDEPRHVSRTQTSFGQATAEAASPKTGLNIGVETALLLAVLWIGTVIGAYIIGGYGNKTPELSNGLNVAGGAAGHQTQDDIDRGNAEREQANRETPSQPAGPALGDWVLVLRSEARWSQSTQDEFDKSAKAYNDAARQHTSLGYKPWFGVRRPGSGGIQFVFGYANGTFGVPKSDELGQKMFKEMRASRFKDAFWIDIRN